MYIRATPVQDTTKFVPKKGLFGWNVLKRSTGYDHGIVFSIAHVLQGQVKSLQIRLILIGRTVRDLTHKVHADKLTRTAKTLQILQLSTDLVAHQIEDQQIVYLIIWHRVCLGKHFRVLVQKELINRQTMIQKQRHKNLHPNIVIYYIIFFTIKQYLFVKLLSERLNP